MRAWRAAAGLLLSAALLLPAAGCGGTETKTGVFKGEVEWSIGGTDNAAETSEKVWIVLDDGEKVLATAPGGRPEIGSTVKVKHVSGDDWEVVDE